MTLYESAYQEKPRLLDLFCGAGGCTRGYQEAGFYVVGVDKEPMPNYCGDEFVQFDALGVLGQWLTVQEELSRPSMVTAIHYQPVLQLDLDDFDAISASPPCQHYANVTAWRGDQSEHPDLVAPTRELLEATGLPYVIENVDKAPLRADFVLCGTMFGLPIQRHRYFETNWVDHTEHWGTLSPAPCGHHPDDYSFDHGAKQPESVYRDAMGCEWMTVQESRQAIPPAYCKFIGERLMAHLEAQTKAAA